VRDEPAASIIQEVMKGYASGRFESQAEVKRYLENSTDFPNINGSIRQQVVSDLFSRVLYAGYIEHEPWGITRRRGHHEPLISFETYERIQARKSERQLAPARADINQDFPLRGALNCACYDAPMTSCWSKSATGKRYPYYWCQTKTCEMYRKSIRAEKIDAAFAELMQSLAPSKTMIKSVTMMLKDAWAQRLAHANVQKGDVQREIDQMDKQLDGLLDRIAETDNPTVVAAYEKKIAKLEQDKLMLADKLDQKTQSKHSLEDIFELSVLFLTSPWKIWEKGGLALKKTVLRTAFKAPLAYSKENGFRTPQTSVIFRFLRELKEKCEMV
ncbi:recombinase zinc beta ribbon domain-containing protein, partial [Pseudaestuariivita rosea]|uniref:recombinase zinc beta ribbon domain-containing protein n=1 Tax=Pseudaestuariivita rosea TaxID=2763263 RepID=UPI001ABB7C2F